MCAALRLTFKRRWYKIQCDVQKFKSLVISCVQFANQLFKQRDYIVSTSAIKTVREFRQKHFYSNFLCTFYASRTSKSSSDFVGQSRSFIVYLNDWEIGATDNGVAASCVGMIASPCQLATNRCVCARFSRRLMIKLSICYTCCALAPMHKYGRFIWVASTFSEASLGN